MSGIVIFGATGGIGSELAMQYAQKGGVELYLSGRNGTVLQELRKKCEIRGTRVKTFSVDLRDRESLFAAIDQILQRGTPEIVIFCAGVSSSVSLKNGTFVPEAQWELERELQVNAFSQIAASNYLALRTKGSQKMTIVLVSSLASLTGLSGSPGYSASKAAVRVYGQAMRKLLKGSGISFTVVVPGFVDSPMSRRYVGKKPFAISAQKAAQKIISGIEKNKAEIYFPSLLYWGIRLLDLLPETMQSYFLKNYFFTVVPDNEVIQREVTWKLRQTEERI